MRLLMWITAAALIYALWADFRDYFTLLRFLVCSVAAYKGYLYWVGGVKNKGAYAFAIAAAFNPIFPVRLERETWNFIDLTVAGLMLVESVKSSEVIRAIRGLVSLVQKLERLVQRHQAKAVFVVFIICPLLLWVIVNSIGNVPSEAPVAEKVSTPASNSAATGSSEITIRSNSEKSTTASFVPKVLISPMKDDMVYTPVGDGTVVAKAGFQTDRRTGRSRFNNGVDFAAKDGDRVYNLLDGVVTQVKDCGRKGVTVETYNSEFKIRMICERLRTYAVKPGWYVKRGRVIGYAGKGSESSLTRVHYVIIRDDNKSYVDPMAFLFKLPTYVKALREFREKNLEVSEKDSTGPDQNDQRSVALVNDQPQTP